MSNYEINDTVNRTYQEYLNSITWARFKDGIPIASRYCRICGKTNDLDYHHIRYDTLGREILGHDVFGLCRKHHYFAHHFLWYRLPFTRRSLSVWLFLMMSFYSLIHFKIFEWLFYGLRAGVAFLAG